MKDPVGRVEAIFAHFSMPVSDPSRRAVAGFTDEHPKSEHGVHRYRGGDFGFERSRLRQRFAFYTSRFGVEAETAR